MTRSALLVFLSTVMLLGCDDPAGPEPVTEVQIDLRPDSLLVEDTLRLRATVQTQGGQAGRAVSWSVRGAAATVDSAGLVRAVEAGAATVFVTVEGMRDSVTLRVVPRQRLFIVYPSADTLLSTPSTRISMHVLGIDPTRDAHYQINGGPRIRTSFRCEHPERCEVYVSQLPEGPSRVTVILDGYSFANPGPPSEGVKTASGTIDLEVRSPARSYRVTSLGPNTRASALNERGEVVGSVTAPWPGRAFLYSSGRLTLLNNGGKSGSEAVAINENGVIAGTVYARADGTVCYNTGVIWTTPESVPSEVFPCNAMKRIGDMNDAGAVVAYDPFGRINVYENGALSYSGRGGGCNYGILGAQISNTGRIAAEGFGDKCVSVSVTEKGGTELQFGPLGRSRELGGINDVGTVAFSAHTFQSDPNEIFLLKGAQSVKVGSYNGSTDARGINNRDEVIAMDRGAPVLWSQGSFYLITLTSPDWKIVDVVDINDAGQIVAAGRNQATGEDAALLLDPVAGS